MYNEYEEAHTELVDDSGTDGWMQNQHVPHDGNDNDMQDDR